MSMMTQKLLFLEELFPARVRYFSWPYATVGVAKNPSMLSMGEQLDSVVSETVQLSCVGPSKDGGGTRSGLVLSGMGVLTDVKASCRRRRTVLY